MYALNIILLNSEVVQLAICRSTVQLSPVYCDDIDQLVPSPYRCFSGGLVDFNKKLLITVNAVIVYRMNNIQNHPIILCIIPPIAKGSWLLVILQQYLRSFS